MALTANFKDTSFGVGDKVKVTQKIQEGEKGRLQVFEGMIIGIKGRGDEKSFVVRKIGAAGVGVERIFPLNAPSLEKIEVARQGLKGVRHAKLLFTREKSTREIEDIYRRAARRSK